VIVSISVSLLVRALLSETFLSLLKNEITSALRKCATTYGVDVFYDNFVLMRFSLVNFYFTHKRYIPKDAVESMLSFCEFVFEKRANCNEEK
jgi:hypothetical protein